MGAPLGGACPLQFTAVFLLHWHSLPGPCWRGFKRRLHARISAELEKQANKNTPDLAVGADLRVALFAFPFFCPRYTKIIVMCSQGCESLLSSRKDATSGLESQSLRLPRLPDQEESI